MTPLEATGLPQLLAADQDNLETAQVAPSHVNYPSLLPQDRTESGMQLVQRSASLVDSNLETVKTVDGETFDPDSVLYARGVVGKIKKNQTLAFLWWQLSKELCSRQWSIRFRGCTNPVDFCQYSGFILDESDRLRVEFSGTIRPSCAGCTATVLSAEKSRKIDVNSNELHIAPTDENPRLIRLLKLVASLK